MESIKLSKSELKEKSLEELFEIFSEMHSDSTKYDVDLKDLNSVIKKKQKNLEDSAKKFEQSEQILKHLNSSKEEEVDIEVLEEKTSLTQEEIAKIMPSIIKSDRLFKVDSAFFLGPKVSMAIYASLKQDNFQIIKKIDNLSLEFEQKSQENESILTKLEEVQNKLNELTQNNAKVSPEEIERYKSELFKQQKALERNAEELQFIKNEKAEALKKKEELEDKNNDLTIELNSLREKLESLENSDNQNNSEFAELKEDYTKEKKRNDKLELTNRENLEMIDNLKKNIETLKTNFDSSKKHSAPKPTRTQTETKPQNTTKKPQKKKSLAIGVSISLLIISSLFGGAYYYVQSTLSSDTIPQLAKSKPNDGQLKLIPIEEKKKQDEVQRHTSGLNIEPEKNEIKSKVKTFESLKLSEEKGKQVSEPESQLLAEIKESKQYSQKEIADILKPRFITMNSIKYKNKTYKRNDDFYGNKIIYISKKDKKIIFLSFKTKTSFTVKFGNKG